VLRFPALSGATASPPANATWAETARRHEVIGFASSIGGVVALSEVLRDVPSDFPTPILIAQHLGLHDPAVLIEGLQRTCRLPVRIAQGGQRIESGVYFAAAGCHLLASADRRFSTPAWGRLRNVCPSADLLFLSLGRVYGEGAIGLVLSGSGRDGAEGSRQLRRRGGFTMAQTPISARNGEMPAAAIETEMVDLVLPIGQIGAALSVLGGAVESPSAAAS
jgi:two-component system, chemotaxis family, protein-glutamate methylesterase/glutaminase